MKKIFLLIAIASLTTFGLSSCKKCITCTATNYTTGLVDDSTEYCGRTASNNLSESTYRLSWEDGNHSVSCN
ncbi:MAG: hypothetical protein HXX09_14975 [Bacteroidetes bacterium]|nr:hypothetical protein [Bacteroidota bacterium]